MTPFSFYLDWELNCQFAGLIWAKEQGLYASAGLDVTLVPPSAYPDQITLDKVLNNPQSAGCMEDNLIVRARLAGHPVKAIGAMLQETPMVLMTRPEDEIGSLHDLPGKRVAMYRDGIHLIKTVLTLHGIPTDEITFTVNDWKPTDLIDQRFDAVQGYTITEPLELERHGLSPRLIPVQHAKLHPYAQMMFTSEAALEEHGDLIRRFLQATYAGWHQALINSDTAAKIVADGSEEQPNPEENEAILSTMQEIVCGQRDFSKIGYLDRERWKHNLQTYADFGMIEQTISVDEVIALDLAI